MLFLFVSATAILLLMVLAAEHVINRFHHTRRSRSFLLAEGAAALILGLVVAYTSFPILHPGARLLIGVLLAAPLAIFTAFVTVELWRKQKQQVFDRHIVRLRREADALMDALDRLRWQLERARVEEERQAGERRPLQDRRRALEAEIERWQGTGGVARLRTIKVQDWQRELAGAGEDELQRREAELEQALRSERDPEREATLRVQLALVRLARLDRGGEAADPPPASERPSERLRGEKVRLEEQLRVLQAELREWERKRAAFLAERIPLD